MVALFRSAAVLKKVSVVVNPSGSSTSRSLQPSSRPTESTTGVVIKFFRMVVSSRARSSEGDRQAHVPGPRVRIGTYVDSTDAGIATAAVDVRVETRVIRRDPQVLAGHEQSCRLGTADQSRRDL